MPRTVIYQTGAHDLARQLFGRVVTDETLARAVGALDGAEVTFSVRREWLLAKVRHPYIESQERSVRRDRAGGLFIYNHEFTKRAGAPSYLGIRALLVQVQAAQRLGVKRIELYGAGDAHSVSRNGYYTWARCGFEANLTLRERHLLSPELRAARTLNELMRQDGGAVWWRKHGAERQMVFDLTPDSTMIQTLRLYARELEAAGWKF